MNESSLIVTALTAFLVWLTQRTGPKHRLGHYIQKLSGGECQGTELLAGHECLSEQQLASLTLFLMNNSPTQVTIRNSPRQETI